MKRKQKNKETEEQLKAYYNKIEYIYSKKHTIGVFYTEDFPSDSIRPDSFICIVVPSMDYLINKKEIYVTNSEYTCIDIRIFLRELCSNPGYLDTLFTNYYIINPKYKKIWNTLIKNKEQIARANPVQVSEYLLNIMKELSNGIINVLETGSCPKNRINILNHYYYVINSYLYNPQKRFKEILTNNKELLIKTNTLEKHETKSLVSNFLAVAETIQNLFYKCHSKEINYDIIYWLVEIICCDFFYVCFKKR